jgi:tripartite motif-containing protein 9/67
MDYELRCPACKDYYQSPVYLPCSHSICYTCALNSLFIESFTSDLDKLSLTSDNDSGISSSSRPCSLLLPPALPKISFLAQEKSSSTYLQCPTCSKTIPLDQSDLKNLPKNRLLADIVHRYHGIKVSPDSTQPIEKHNPDFYCLNCRSEYCQDDNHEMTPLHQAVKIYKVNQAKRYRSAHTTSSIN